jgi:hypothetical protein
MRNALTQLNTLKYFCSLALALCSVTLSTDAEADERIRLGYITDLSGQGAYYGKYSALGAQLAAEEIRKAGGGITLEIEDHAFQAPKAVTAAQKLLEIDKVQGLITEFSFVTNAVAPLAFKSKVLFLGVSPAVSFLKINPNAFKTFLDYEQGCRKIAEYWRRTGVTKVAVLKVITESGELCLAGTRQIFPDLIIEEFTIGSDVTSQILRLKTKSPQAIMAPAFEGDALNLFRVLKQVNWHPRIGFDVRDSLTNLVRKSYPDFIDSAVGFGFSPPPAVLTKILREKSPDITDLGLEAGALAYLHVHQLWQSLNACKDNDCSVRTLSASPSDINLEFQGWKDRVAQFNIHLFSFKGEHLEKISLDKESPTTESSS